MITQNPSINLKELSVLTGFSVSTVSKALNNKRDISTKTKRYIMEIAKDYNYVPNSFAVGLRNKKSKAIAIILPQVNIKIYGDILCNFQKVAGHFNYRIVVFQSFEKVEKEKEYLNSICDGSIDGSIVISSITNNYNFGKFAIPITSVVISNSESQNISKEFCHKLFENLLHKIDLNQHLN